MISVIRHKKGIEEDTLTGNFFGAIRYTSSFEAVLSKILKTAEFDCQEKKKAFAELMKTQSSACFNKINIHFWKFHEQGEPDLIIEFSDAVMLIEIKFNKITAPILLPAKTTKK